MLTDIGNVLVIDPHQDIVSPSSPESFARESDPHATSPLQWSRATGGSGAPYWTLIAAGFQPRRFHSTCAAYLHSQWEEGKGSVDFPDSECSPLRRAYWRSDCTL